MILIVSKYLIPKGYLGFTFFPFVFLKNKESKADLIMLNHERIHLRQQLELLILPFFIWYLVEFLWKYLKYRNRAVAYKAISFEREAYENETNLDYIKQRRFLSFVRNV